MEQATKKAAPDTHSCTFKAQSKIFDLILSDVPSHTLPKKALSIIKSYLSADEFCYYRYCSATRSYLLEADFSSSIIQLAEKEILLSDETNYLHNDLSDNIPVIIKSPADLKSDILKKFLVFSKVKSMLAYPVFDAGKYHGFIGMLNIADISCFDDYQKVLKTTSKFVSDCLQKESLIRLKEKSESKYKSLYNHISSYYTNC